MLAEPPSTAIQMLSHRKPVQKTAAMPASRSGDRIVCLIVALLLLPMLTTKGQAQPPGPVAGILSLPTLAPLVKQILPGVVSISVKRRAPPEGPPLIDPGSGFPDAPYRSTDREISAAGVIVDGPRGLIVTATHVIEHADSIWVTISDGRVLQGSRVAGDPNTDIAVIRIAASDLVGLPMGDSDLLEVGDYVIAVGNPFGMGTTVSHAIVSALHRSGLHLGVDQDFIQTDAPLNPGNSGGALVNQRGELVGIATAITGPTGNSVGIGFAIPINRVRKIVDHAANYGEPEPARRPKS